MRLFNRIEIFGRVTKDPIIRETVTDAGVNYRLVWDIAQYQGKNDTAFWSCVMFGDIDYLEKESKKLQRGHMVYVAGQAKKTKNETKTASGAVIYSDSVIVLVREINDCESRPDTSDSNESGSGDGTGATDADIAAADKDEDDDGFKGAAAESEIPPFDNSDQEKTGINHEDSRDDPEADHTEANEEDQVADESSDGENYNGYD